jgi:hypothetical protein
LEAQSDLDPKPYHDQTKQLKTKSGHYTFSSMRKHTETRHVRLTANAAASKQLGAPTKTALRCLKGDEQPNQSDGVQGQEQQATYESLLNTPPNKSTLPAENNSIAACTMVMVHAKTEQADRPSRFLGQAQAYPPGPAFIQTQAAKPQAAKNAACTLPN